MTPFLLDSFNEFYTRFFAIKWMLIAVLPFAICLLGLRRRKIDLPLLAVSAYLLISVGSTIGHAGLSNESLRYIFPFLVAYLVFLAVQFSAQDLLGHYLGLLRTFLIILLLPSMFLLLEPSAYEQGRYNGLFFNANTNAGLYAVLFAVVLPEIDAAKGPSKIFRIFLMLSSAYIVYQTQSRWTLAVVASMAAVHVFFFGSAASWPPLLRLSLFLGVIVASVAYTFSLDALLSLNVGGRNIFDLSNRLNIFERQMSAFREHPLFGTGLVINRDALNARFGGELAWTDILSYSGIAGVGMLTLASVHSIIRTFRRGRLAKNYLYPVFTIVLLSVFEGYISNVGGVLSLLFWFFLGGGGYPGPYVLRPEGAKRHRVWRRGENFSIQ